MANIETKQFFSLKKNYKLEENYSIYVTDFDDIIYNCDIFNINLGVLTIYKGFEWNGCTLVWDGDKIDPPKDFPKVIFSKKGLYYTNTIRGSLLHDALYSRFKELEKLGIKRIEIDNLFFKLMNEDKFKYARLYYNAVRIIGGFVIIIEYLFNSKIKKYIK